MRCPAAIAARIALDGLAHVPEQERVVQRLLAGEEGPRLLGVAVAAPDEHACRDLAEAELPERGRSPAGAGTDGSSRCPQT